MNVLDVAEVTVGVGVRRLRPQAPSASRAGFFVPGPKRRSKSREKRNEWESYRNGSNYLGSGHGRK